MITYLLYQFLRLYLLNFLKVSKLRIITYFSVIAVSLLISCGSDNTPQQPNPSPAPSAIPSPELENPLSKGEIFGVGGNLWKPVSDTNGNMVVVLDTKFQKIFTYGCYATLKNNTKQFLFCDENIGLKCFGNGNRLHLRSRSKCDAFKEVRVVCEEEKQTVVFQTPKGQLSQVCKRFG